MAEQLGLDQLARDRGHVERHERRAAARPEIVDRLGDQLLAGARFARDQHGEVVGDHAGDDAIDFLHRRRAADQRGAAAQLLLGQRGGGVAAAGDGAAHRLAEHVEVERLGEIVEGADFGGAHRRRQGVPCREDVHRQRGMLGGEPGHLVEAVAVGQHHVGDQHIGQGRADRAAQLRQAGRRRDGMAFAAQRRRHHRADRAVVVDDQDRAGHARALGRRMRKTVISGMRSRAYWTMPP